MRLDTIALVIVIAFGVLWLATAVTGILAALPYGILALIPIAVVVGLLATVIAQRLSNKEDDYYDKNVDK
ncbi:hypothetical protein [Pelagibacterium limicola]|uniref:hypothetical protein n=1 Tax=Pelagibacterium limicola TaxID=2791022 RepID=UPI0018AF5568|nr:hypothetical protein [Pelagibacterium limicola]